MDAMTSEAVIASVDMLDGAGSTLPSMSRGTSTDAAPRGEGEVAVRCPVGYPTRSLDVSQRWSLPPCTPKQMPHPAHTQVRIWVSTHTTIIQAPYYMHRS